MPYIRVWVHLIWATKYREPLLYDVFRNDVFNHIRENARKKNIFVAEINGYRDHVHCLVSLKFRQSISKVVNLIKGESSHWFNQQNLINRKFSWQTEYYAESVGKSGIARVRKYIRNQEAHHQKQSFQDEIEFFAQKYGFVLQKDSEE